MVAGIGLPIDVADTSVTMGATVKNYYVLPTNSNDYLRPTIDVARRSTYRPISTTEVYETISGFLER